MPARIQFSKDELLQYIQAADLKALNFGLMAKDFNVCKATLRRRLTKCCTSYRKLLDDEQKRRLEAILLSRDGHKWHAREMAKSLGISQHMLYQKMNRWYNDGFIKTRCKFELRRTHEN